MIVILVPRFRDYFATRTETVGADLADGLAGYLLFSAALRATGFLAPSPAEAEVEILRRCLSWHTGDFSLFSGWSGVHAASSYAFGAEAPTRPLISIRKAVDSAMERRLTRPFSRVRSIYELDLIGGLAGMAFAAGHGVLALFGEYCSWLSDAPAERLLLESVSDFPWYDVGLAHGISGLVSALALNSAEDASDRALHRLCAFVTSQAEEGDAATLRFTRTPPQSQKQHAAASWCYGGLGVAAGLSAAFLRTRDDHHVACAVRAALSATEPTAGAGYWSEPDLNLCHGAAGNALILATVAGVSGNVEVRNRALMAVERILESFDRNKQFGFSTFLADGSAGDSASLLMGSMGIILGLATLAEPQISAWMRYFGLPPLIQQ